MPQQPLTTGQAAKALNVPEWKLRRVVDHIAPETPRVGNGVRLIPADSMRTLADALHREGYIAEKPG